MLAIFAAVLYYGWPIIEAILITLPIPDPKTAKETLMGWFNKLRGMVGGMPQGDSPNKDFSADYRQDFEQAPDNFGQDDEDEDDSEDVGKHGFEDRLNYDSDEKNEGAEAAEMI